MLSPRLLPPGPLASPVPPAPRLGGRAKRTERRASPRPPRNSHRPRCETTTTNLRFSERAGATGDRWEHTAFLRDAMERKTLVLDHVRTDPRLAGAGMTQAGAECAVLLPLTMGDEFVAAMVVCRTTPLPFTPDDVSILEDVARPVTTAVANALAFEEIQKLRSQLAEENVAPAGGDRRNGGGGRDHRNFPGTAPGAGAGRVRGGDRLDSADHRGYWHRKGTPRPCDPRRIAPRDPRHGQGQLRRSAPRACAHAGAAAWRWARRRDPGSRPPAECEEGRPRRSRACRGTAIARRSHAAAPAHTPTDRSCPSRARAPETPLPCSSFCSGQSPMPRATAVAHVDDRLTRADTHARVLLPLGASSADLALPPAVLMIVSPLGARCPGFAGVRGVDSRE